MIEEVSKELLVKNRRIPTLEIGLWSEGTESVWTSTCQNHYPRQFREDGVDLDVRIFSRDEFCGALRKNEKINKILVMICPRADSDHGSSFLERIWEDRERHCLLI